MSSMHLLAASLTFQQPLQQSTFKYQGLEALVNTNLGQVNGDVDLVEKEHRVDAGVAAAENIVVESLPPIRFIQ